MPKKSLRRPGAVLGIIIAASALMLASCAPRAERPAFDQSQSLEINDIAHYLDSLKHLEASFTQSGSFGEGSGLIWLDRPGKLRIDYAGPQSSVMVANAGRLVVFDRHTRATTTMSVSRTPLGLLLAPVIDLSTDVTVTSLTHEQDGTQITLQKTSAPSQGTLTLALGGHPRRLIAVSVVDARGRVLTMSLYNLRSDPVLTPDLFANPATPPPAT